jgi:hypothetical protein
MEIALLSPTSLRIKSKSATLCVDQSDKATYDADLLVTKTLAEVTPNDETVILSGPGEYEIGGTKITGLRSEQDMLYTLKVDGVDIALGKIDALNKMQHKLKENNIIIVLCDVVESAAFLTSLASNVVMLYGEKAAEIAGTFGKAQVKTLTKYSSTKDKLPTEVETVLLQ